MSKPLYNNHTFYPILNLEEEQSLLKSYKESGDSIALDKLVSSHMRMVINIAQGLDGYDLPIEDLIQEGSIGLIKAINNFDSGMDSRLCSYAVVYVRSIMLEYVVANVKIVKIATTKNQRKAFFNVRKHKKDMINNNTKEETDNLAQKLSISERDVTEMETRIFGKNESYDSTFVNDEFESSPSGYLHNRMDQPEVLFEEQDTKRNVFEILDNALGKLNDRAKYIVENRVVNKTKTLMELAEHFGVSYQRIKQIENKSLMVVRKELNVALHRHV